MQVQFYSPHPLLQGFVNCIMIVHADAGPAKRPAICPYPPTPQNSLFFYINDRISVQKNTDEAFQLQPRSVVVGPQLNRVNIDIKRSHKAVRVGFHPGGLFRMLGFPMSYMVDGSYDAADVFGHGIRELNEQLQEAPGFEEIRQVIETFLLRKANALKPSLPFDQAMLELIRGKGNVTITQLASLACVSMRQFERICKQRIGLPPKLFARLVRFSHAYRLYENNPEVNWTKVAYESGYFDQMHLIRDFKEFAGVPPRVIEKELAHTPVRLQAGLRL